MKKSAVEELVGKKLPNIELFPDKMRDKAENKDEIVIQESLKDENADVCNKQYFYGRRDAPAAEPDTSSLVNHYLSSNLSTGPLHPVPQGALCLSAGMNVPDSLQGQCPKAPGVSPWFGVHLGRHVYFFNTLIIARQYLVVGPSY